ncbi:D-alanyl-D-alanine carboxypeptidase family protein [soil metagenome]
MHPADWRLINGERLEAIPAQLARGRGNAVARALSGADWLLRRKRDGRYVAVGTAGSVHKLLRGALDRAERDDLAALEQADQRGGSPRPVSDLRRCLQALGLDEATYAGKTSLALVAEPHVLTWAGRDRYHRPLWLLGTAARAWRAMQAAARAEGIALEAISGYRSHEYQLGIFRRKLSRGDSMSEILRVNAAPGFSEHHAGHAIDIGTRGEPPAEESFETTPAFAWLRSRAVDFRFTMSYPRGNLHGIDYEPWHWRHEAE